MAWCGMGLWAVRRLFVIALALTIVVPAVAVMLVFAAVSSPAQCGSAAPVGVGSAPGVPSELLAIYSRRPGATSSARRGGRTWLRSTAGACDASHTHSPAIGRVSPEPS